MADLLPAFISIARPEQRSAFTLRQSAYFGNSCHFALIVEGVLLYRLS